MPHTLIFSQLINPMNVPAIEIHRSGQECFDDRRGFLDGVHSCAKTRAQIDPEDGDSLHEHLVAAIKRNNLSTRDIAKYVLDVHQPGGKEPIFGFTALTEHAPR